MIDQAATGLAPVVAAVDSWPAVAGLALVILGPPVITYLQGRLTKKLVAQTKALAAQAAADAAQTREQTVNEHQGHPTPNLREQLDAIHADVREAKTIAHEAKSAAESAGAALVAHINHADEVDARRDQWQTSIEDELARRRPILAWRR